MIESIQAGMASASLVEPGQREVAKDTGSGNASPVDTTTISNSSGPRPTWQETSDMTSEEADTTLSWIRQALAGQDASFPHTGLTADRVMQLVGLVA